MRIFVFALLFATSLAQAKVESNYTLTPSAGQSEVLPGVTLIVSNQEFKNDGGDIKGAGVFFSGKYFYGITDFLSAGVEVGYGTARSELNRTGFSTETFKAKGFMDPIVRVKGNLDVDDLGVYYALGYGIGAEDSEYNTDSNEGNLASGNNSYHLEAGVAVPVNEYTIGGHLLYTKNLEGKEFETTNGVKTEYKTEESTMHSLRLYMEFQKQYHLTGAFIHQRVSELYHGLEFTARFETSPQSEIIPTVTSLVAKHPDRIGMDVVSLVYLGATFRYLS